jgi:hypothetical protein
MPHAHRTAAGGTLSFVPLKAGFVPTVAGIGVLLAHGEGLAL